MEAKKTTVSIYLDAELVEKIRQAAEKENRTISNYIETILKESLK